MKYAMNIELFRERGYERIHAGKRTNQTTTPASFPFSSRKMTLCLVPRSDQADTNNFLVELERIEGDEFFFDQKSPPYTTFSLFWHVCKLFTLVDDFEVGDFEWFNKQIATNEEQKTAIKNIVNYTAYQFPYVCIVHQ
jgi:hypothetical protein